ncbi:MAG: aminotransferase class V-fold PLP-dependent enzyme [Acidobacteriota bacterium]
MPPTHLQHPPGPDRAGEPREALDAACRLFEPADGTTYLDSATYGLPPRTTLEAMHRALDRWRGGTGHWRLEWERDGEACRGLFADLVGGRPDEVALLPAVSVASAFAAAAVPKGGEVLVAEGDFTSVLYPFLVAQSRGDLTVREAPAHALAESITPRTDLVAFSVVQSGDGQVADLHDISAAARSHGALVYGDASQALGMLPIDVHDAGFDVLAAAGYKWLCCPRGAAFLWLRPELNNTLVPLTASWRGGDDPFGRYYGSPLALADDAARFNISLAWHVWVGAKASLEVFTSTDAEARFARARAAAAVLRERLDLPDSGSSIVSVPVTESRAAGQILEHAGVRVSVRAGAIRVSPHFYNTAAEAERIAELLLPLRTGAPDR